MLQVQRSHKVEGTADVKWDNIEREAHTVPGSEEVSHGSQLPFPFPSFPYQYTWKEENLRFQWVKFLQVLVEELMGNSCYSFKSTFSSSVIKPPRPGPCLEEPPRCSIKASGPPGAPLFQGVGWTHCSPMLVWFINTLVLSHWHLQSRKSHLLRLEMETFTRCRNQLYSGKDHWNMLWDGCLGKILSRLFGLEPKLLRTFPELITGLSYARDLKVSLLSSHPENQRHKVMKNL